MKSSLKRLPLPVLKMSSLTAILRQVLASLQEPKQLQRVQLSRILLVQQYLLTLHLLMSLLSQQKQLLHSLVTRPIKRLKPLNLVRQLQPIGVLNLPPTNKIQMKISQRLLRSVSIHYQDKKSLSLEVNSHPTIKAIGTIPRTEKISLDGIMQKIANTISKKMENRSKANLLR